MPNYHLAQTFLVPQSPDTFEQCDMLMDQLMDMEDGTVCDAAVSADTERRIVTIEVSISAPDEASAEFFGTGRVREAMQHAGIPIAEIRERREMDELVAA